MYLRANVLLAFLHFKVVLNFLKFPKSKDAEQKQCQEISEEGASEETCLIP